ncbi:MAG: hypothetical protein NC337_04170 [Roseburia sp.]|nr:hypothetical protein [Roseburia sp.]
MMNRPTKGTAGRWCAVLCFTLALVLVPAVFFDFYYDLNDDTAIKDILSGTYTGLPSGYGIQLLFPLSWVIAGAYRILPAVPWYGLFLCVCQFGAFALMAWRLTGRMRRGPARAAALSILALAALGLFLRQLVIVQYSVTSGLCMACAVFLFLTGENADKPSVFVRRNVVPALLVVLSFMIRTEMCMMLMPFLIFAGLVKWSSEERVFTGTNFRKYLFLFAGAMLGILVMFSLDSLAYSGSEWRSFRSFFDARTKLYDFYDLPPYDDENAAFYESIGLSEESFTLLENYNFALDESIDAWMLESIAAYQRQRACDGKGLHATLGYVTRRSPAEALWQYRERMLSGLAGFGATFFEEQGATESAAALSGETVGGYAVLGAYVLYVLLCILPACYGKKWKSFVKILALAVIRSVLWLYLYMVDRALERVTIPLLMAELATLAGLILSEYRAGAPRERRGGTDLVSGIANTAICVLGLLFLAAAFRGSYNRTAQELRDRAAADVRWEALKSYCAVHPDDFYVIDVYSSTSYGGAPYSEKIFENADSAYRNFDICGGWVAKSPLYRQKLARAGLRDVQSALCARKAGAGTKAYFVAAPDKDITWLEAYYAKRGIAAEAVRVDTICTSEGTSAFAVYALSVSGA